MLRHSIKCLSLCMPTYRVLTTHGKNIRLFSSDLENKFKQRQKSITHLKEEPNNDYKLRLYALFKQSTIGPCNTPKPGVLEIVAKYKWEAWNQLQQLSKEDAMKQYIIIVDELIEKIGLSENKEESNASSTSSSTELLLNEKNGVLTITLNRPKRMNSLTIDMYRKITETLNQANINNNIRIVVVTGTGDYYSSGNDLKNFKMDKNTDIIEEVRKSKNILQEFVDSFITFRKPLIAAVNGPCIGIMVTTLGLFDVVICTDTTTFSTPFSALAQTPEGCSTALFPKIFGPSLANEILLFNRKITAEEALKYGFVSQVIPKTEFASTFEKWMYDKNGILDTCFQRSLIFSKALIKNDETIEYLKKVNALECQTLSEAWLSSEFKEAISKFFLRKNK